jgi:hypothetical protein
MDYRESIEVLKWHLTNTNLSGIESKVLLAMIINANYKAGTISISLNDIAVIIRSSKKTTAAALQTLLNVGAVTVISKGTGHAPTLYKIRSAENMDTLCTKEIKNPLYEDWVNTHYDLFHEIEDKITDLDPEECEECKESKNVRCEFHTYTMNKIKDSTGFREMLLWEADRPEPERTVKIISLPEGRK